MYFFMLGSTSLKYELLSIFQIGSPIRFHRHSCLCRQLAARLLTRFWDRAFISLVRSLSLSVKKRDHAGGEGGGHFERPDFYSPGFLQEEQEKVRRGWRERERSRDRKGQTGNISSSITPQDAAVTSVLDGNQQKNRTTYKTDPKSALRRI